MIAHSSIRQGSIISSPAEDGRKVFFHVVSVLALMLLSTLTDAADPIGEEKREFNIPQQRADLSLTQFAEQADLTLIFRFKTVKKKTANRLEGSYPVNEAIDLLLAGTGLQPVFSDQGLLMSVSDNKSEAEGEEMNVKKKAGFAAFLAGLFSVSAGAQEPADTDVTEPQLEEIVVVGTNFRGVEAVGVDVIILDREYIELSGISTTTELIQSVPQNFGLGNEAVEGVGVITGTGRNWGFSSAVNLRGLGTDSTLLLLNGRRSASGGSAGSFVDLNTIPTAAIERIEVLPDGASAIYGSDAVGGVVNVILRDDYEGAVTSVRYAPGTSDIDEIQFSQVFGKKWDSGRLLFTYEYYDRSELKAADRVYTRDSDLTSLGGGNHSVTTSNPGNILNTSFQPAFAIPAGQDGTALTTDDLIDLDPVTGNPDATNFYNVREGSHILPEQTRHSVFVSASQALSNTIDLFAEARYSTRDFEFLNNSPGAFLAVPETNAFFVDPFAGAGAFLCPFIGGGPGNCVVVDYNTAADYGPPRSAGEVEAFGGVLGVTFSLGDSWELEVYGSYGSEDTANRADQFPNNALLAVALADADPATAFNSFGDGSNTNPATLAAIAGFADIDVESELTTFNVHLEGDLFDLPGGAAKLAVGGQFRDQSLISKNIFFLFTTDPAPGNAPDIFELDRDIKAAFAEVYLPLVTDQNSRPGIKELAISIAGRYEDYSDFGDTFDPKLGVAWSPVDSLKLRGTVGTSFRAPLLTELNTTNNRILLVNLVDPASPTGRTRTLLLLGNASGLVPQEGTTWTAGFDVTPKSLPGFKVGLTYFSTEVDNVIQRPASALTRILIDPITNAPVITFDPDDAAVTALFNDPDFTATPIPPDQVGAIVNGRVQNVAKSELSGLDLNLGYAFDTAAGAFNLSLYASHLFEFKQQLLNGPVVDNVDNIGKPNSLNLRSSLSWSSGGMNAVLIVRHIGAYTDNLGSVACSITPCSVNSWTTWDAQLGYDFSNRFSGFLDGTRLSLGVQNVFDKDPPFVDVADTAVGFDAINSNPLGRYAALQLTKTW